MTEPCAGSDATDLIQSLLNRLGAVVHQLQRERGCASLFIDSLGKTFKNRVTDQMALVDETIAELQLFCQKSDLRRALPSSFEGRLNFLFQKYAQLAALRGKINFLSVRYTQAINSYTFTYIVPTIDAMIELAQREEAHNSALVSAYSNFLQWKERVGMERALGARGFYTFSFRNQEFCDRFIALIAEQRNYFNTFKALASPSQIALLQACINQDDLDEVQALNKLLEDGAPINQIEQFSAESWFELLTRMIETLRKAEVDLVGGLQGKPVQNNAPPFAPQLLMQDNKVSNYRGFIKSLSSFAKIDDHDLDELLSFAQIRKYDKDTLLFLRDEPVSRIYIVLNGWVKLFNGLETGEEAILQIVGSGEMLLESEVFLNVPTPVSAQVVENATLMSIPAPVIRQRIQSNTQLAVNMLSAISIRSQRLIQQIEISRLKTAKERVGWFLLRLVINQRPTDNKIFLPYEKSVIASYLDMRPETFSRTLQKFKLEGFEIAHESITMPHEQALCHFCDVELASQCVHSQTASCPNSDLAKIFSTSAV